MRAQRDREIANPSPQSSPAEREGKMHPDGKLEADFGAALDADDFDLLEDLSVGQADEQFDRVALLARDGRDLRGDVVGLDDSALGVEQHDLEGGTTHLFVKMNCAFFEVFRQPQTPDSQIALVGPWLEKAFNGLVSGEHIVEEPHLIAKRPINDDVPAGINASGRLGRRGWRSLLAKGTGERNEQCRGGENGEQPIHDGFLKGLVRPS